MIGDFFEQYVNVDWPGWILTECTNIIDDADGMKHRTSWKCLSCWEYQRRTDKYFSDRVLATTK
jgi:hypothetical protein